MATSILAIGTGETASSDITVAAGTPVTVGLKTASAPSTRDAGVSIQLKDDTGAYFTVAELIYPMSAAVVLHGPGVYRVLRGANAGSCGAFTG